MSAQSHAVDTIVPALLVGVSASGKAGPPPRLQYFHLMKTLYHPKIKIRPTITGKSLEERYSLSAPNRRLYSRRIAKGDENVDKVVPSALCTLFTMTRRITVSSPISSASAMKK